MKIEPPRPWGVTNDSIRNWATSARKDHSYEDNYDSIFKKRTNRPGYTKTVYRANGKKEEFADADKLSPSEMGLTLKVTGIV